MADLNKQKPTTPPPMAATTSPGTPSLKEETVASPMRSATSGPPLQGTALSRGNNIDLKKQEQAPVLLDDVDRMLCHEDFPSLLALAVRVKQIREAASNLHNNNNNDEPKRTASEMDPQQVINAVSRMQQQHLQRNYKNPPVIQRGTYHMTDSLLNENFHILQQEMERCTKYIAQAKEHAAYQQQQEANNGIVSVAAVVASPPPPKPRSSTSGDAICNKYSKWQTDILMNWMLDHVQHPFPTSTQIDELCKQTGLNHGQVVNWTTNMRKRSLKASVEKKKKPHHFLDYKFMANDREQKEKQQQQQQLVFGGHVVTPNPGGVVVPNGAYSPGPYADAIGASPPNHHVYSPAPTPGHYNRPDPSTMHHGQVMGSPPPPPPPVAGYHLYTDCGQPQQPSLPFGPPTPQAHHYGSDTRQDDNVVDLDWDRKIQQVSETFHNPDNAYCVPEEMGEDPLLDFAHAWAAGGNVVAAADDDMRDDVVMDDNVMMDTTTSPCDFVDVNFDMDTTESYPSISKHGQAVQYGETWSSSVFPDMADNYDPFPPFHEVHPTGGRVGKQESAGSFSLGDVSDFESELDMETSVLEDMPDLLVEGV